MAEKELHEDSRSRWSNEQGHALLLVLRAEWFSDDRIYTKPATDGLNKLKIKKYKAYMEGTMC